MPIAVLLKHLGRLTANKVLAAGSADVAAVCERIQDETALKKVGLQQHHCKTMVASINASCFSYSELFLFILFLLHVIISFINSIWILKYMNVIALDNIRCLQTIDTRAFIRTVISFSINV